MIIRLPLLKAYYRRHALDVEEESEICYMTFFQLYLSILACLTFSDPHSENKVSGGCAVPIVVIGQSLSHDCHILTERISDSSPDVY